MKRCLVAVSPHLDDALFSAGGTLARCARRGWRVVIATCFTGNVDRPANFALACQLDKGIAAEVDYMALRRAEDQVACAAIGAVPVHLPFLEAPHRGYANAAALFAGRRADDDVEPALTAALHGLIATYRPALVLGPYGLGRHVDHLIVRSSLDSLGRFPRRRLWQDWPYADCMSSDLPAPAWDAEVMLDPVDRAAMTAGCLGYVSQLGFQFGSVERMTSLLAVRRSERFVRADASVRC